ncbi:hypothetical protein BDV95DRAFT_492981 [Massariosphaeria phaeospora]|uniref:SH3 domain-containing protein n=1 Tax=Massariosphaeria phaeospora TaxID=100035 RepID=A0A7C8M6M7_9PLEO|nr:hypothetical protein BDV95DRAFT_492981 [Massariosphaeria phaeospora]
MPGTAASEPPSVAFCFANNFWGKDDAGVGPLLERMHNSKVTSDELKSFYAARAAIEDEYARKLLNLSRKPLGSHEAGTLRLSFDVIRGEVESMAKAHQSIASQMKTELEEPLTAFAGGMKERRKIVQGGIEKLLKIKMQQTSTVNKARDRYEQDCLKIKGFLAQAHMVMGQEERKNKAKLEKTQIQLSSTANEYEVAVKVLEETTGRWNRDWKVACDKFQDLEEERIDFTKCSLWNFANIASTVCISDDAACEKVRLSLEDCDVEKDITAFIKDNGTGQEIPDPPKYINFCRGDADTASETSEDGNYSVAQFQRTMNPAYRASSPQPSMFESHHDPNNPLARELGLGDGTMPASAQDQDQAQPRHQAPPVQPMPIHPRQRSQASQPMHPRQPSQASQSMHSRQPSQASQPLQPMAMHPPQPSQPVQPARSIQPDPRLVHAQQQAHQQYQQSQVPHNDYPMDGMTQFCRIGPPSDRSTIPSPARPSSRDSQSEYSNPTSFSSMEPPSGSASPGKPMAQSPQPLDESQVQRKKGFFQNSPFRRKSKQEREPPSGSITPSSRNTWGPAERLENNENVSPTRPFANSTRGTILRDTRTASPEPVDPRANFQLNIGNNVFDVASPDARKQKEPQKEPKEQQLDPIAQALAELKGVTKQSSVRVSADRYHGLATPVPPGTPSVGGPLPGAMPTPLANVTLKSAQRGTPPPSYEQPPMSRLGAPKPAHTARQMQKTTQMYVDQKANVFNTGVSSRPSTRGTTGQEAPRPTSPAPSRATSPRPSLYTAPQPRSYTAPQPQSYAAPQPQSYTAQQPQSHTAQQPQSYTAQQPQSYTAQQPQSPAAYRAASPNPKATSSAGGRPRTRTQSSSPVKPQYGTSTSRNSYSSSRGNSPAATNMPRAVSPQPGYSNTRPSSRAAPISRAASPQPNFRQSYDRPSSSRGSDMALQLAPGPGSERGGGSQYGGSQYGGSQRGRGSGGDGQRPQSSYYGGSGSEMGYGGGSSTGGDGSQSSRVRSKSLAEPRQYTRDGRMIMHYSRAMYLYTAQIPEELTFAKGDILAVLRLQDDGWWEAEVVGRNGRGLVPSNYLQNC